MTLVSHTVMMQTAGQHLRPSSECRNTPSPHDGPPSEPPLPCLLYLLVTPTSTYLRQSKKK